LQRYGEIPNLKVTIVGHSMGWLVCRLALLQHGDKLPFVKRLVMLGTPNHGTLHTGQLGILSQLVREITGKNWVLTTNKTGVLELTQIDKLLELDAYWQQGAEERTLHVEYISIPATCFHEDAGILESVVLQSSRRIALVPLSMELLKVHPCWRVQLKRPHDGIVEESSVFLFS
jgi:pimeloyl-ACP methyl ester carboxylesterase